MSDIEDKYNKWLTETDSLSKEPEPMSFKIFKAGYLLAKKELEEQIKRKEDQLKEVEKIAESLSSLTPYGDKRFELYSRKYYSRA